MARATSLGIDGRRGMTSILFVPDWACVTSCPMAVYKEFAIARRRLSRRERNGWRAFHGRKRDSPAFLSSQQLLPMPSRRDRSSVPNAELFETDVGYLKPLGKHAHRLSPNEIVKLLAGQNYTLNRSSPRRCLTKADMRNIAPTLQWSFGDSELC